MAWYYITRCKRPLDIVIVKLNDQYQQKFYPTSLSSSNKCCFIPLLRFETIAAKSEAAKPFEENVSCPFAGVTPRNPCAHIKRSNAHNAAKHSTCPSGQNTATKTQCGIFGNAKRAIMPSRLPSHMNRWRHNRVLELRNTAQATIAMFCVGFFLTGELIASLEE